MTTTAAPDLRAIALHWTDLRDALGTPPTIGAFGRGLRGYLAALEQLDAEEQEAERRRALALRTLERDPGQIGERPAPLRLHILDTMRVVEAALVHCADTIARQAQREPMAMPSARTADYRSEREARLAYEDRQRRTQLARTDLEDPRRWRYTGQRTAPHAALWLLARIERAPGPCRRLTEAEEQHIANVAQGAAERIERALDIAGQVAPLAEPCPRCKGKIEMHGGAGASPVAHCTRCGHTWHGAAVA